jgi:hypothetical protein
VQSKRRASNRGRLSPRNEPLGLRASEIVFGGDWSEAASLIAEALVVGGASIGAGSAGGRTVFFSRRWTASSTGRWPWVVCVNAATRLRGCGKSKRWSRPAKKGDTSSPVTVVAAAKKSNIDSVKAGDLALVAAVVGGED